MTPIVLVPGLLCSAEVFGSQVEALWPYGPVTVASTLTGKTMGEIAASILENAPPRFALAGISMGGYLSFEILRQAPERVMKLALLDTSARPDTPEQTANRRAILARTESEDFQTLAAGVAMAIFHPDRQNDQRLREVSERMIAAVGLEGFKRQTEAIIERPDSVPGLAAIQVPTLVLVGDGDALTPVERAQEMALAIPGARLVIVKDCGHGSTLEQPEAVNRALIGWITG
ncbi:putative hydrolase or acyltransferase of alpha/beta superfamily [Terriglobus roseus DSM 18391]|uniref:Putative hydrolase or acyltransferase of alpha/beta superfamily n=1 Tax=Terriglobus roseus (strain DSM 18391 / NRRL B-41598 / KBS 63) TaxID=926566 RepID=I3ZL36_TERRK|nr:alpha/beta fold hydrolase [Terriglobus roseus]AFL89954.1 putative hydrolase or acyltransferase of alpha/beta superfamily [Terriglobus roseus DSM 18391]